MSYCISYDKNTGAMEIQRKRKINKRSIRIILITVLVGATLIFPKTRRLLKTVILPGDEEVTGQALQSLVEDLHQGSSIPEAVDAFCREIIAHE